MIDRDVHVNEAVADNILKELHELSAASPADDMEFSELANSLHWNIDSKNRRVLAETEMLEQAKSWAERPVEFYIGVDVEAEDGDEDYYDWEDDTFEPIHILYTMASGRVAIGESYPRNLLIEVNFKVTTGGPAVYVTFKRGRMPEVKVIEAGQEPLIHYFGDAEFSLVVLDAYFDNYLNLLKWQLEV